MSNNEEALICDFGMSKIIEDITEQSASATLTKSGSSRWLAPEIIEGTLTFPDIACDVYSFGMTIYECLTGTVPFASLKRDAQVIRQVTQSGARPQRPQGGEGSVWITDEVWGILQKCWRQAPKDRPKMKGLCEEMSRIQLLR